MNLTELKHRYDVGDVLNALGLTGFGLEVGVAYGEYSEQVLKKWRGHGIFLVDPWRSQPPEDYVDGSAHMDFDATFSHAMDRLSKFQSRSISLRMMSDEAVKLFPDKFFDFVYIDGNHHEPQITRDLTNWYPKVKSGGLFGGHDYYDVNQPHNRCEVLSAVTKFCKSNKLEVNHTTTGEADESFWMIVK